LVTRVVQTAGFNYWESGMDLRLGEDLFDSFIVYQGRLLKEFDTMAGEYEFQVVDTSVNIETVSLQIKAFLEPLLIPV
jgi:dTMP kinase